jgi:hypothetical protein
MRPLVPQPSTFYAAALKSSAVMRAMRSLAEDSNPSGFTAHRETGNPGAASFSHLGESGSVGHRGAGQGGETPNLFARAEHARARREACKPGRVFT